MKARNFNSHSQQSNDALFQKIAPGLILIVVSPFISLVSNAAEPRDQEAARGHESKAENREGSQEEGVGVALDGAGDEKALASSTYKLASDNWAKAATEYETAGDLDKAHMAQFNADTTLEAAKRTLMEAIDSHRRAVKQFQDSNSLDKKTGALEKIAANLEKLMKLE